MKRLILGFALLGVFTAVALDAKAADEKGFIYGEETNGITVSKDDSDLNVRIRLQPRLDYGDIIKSRDAKSYTNTQDLYLRRIRLELTGSAVTKAVKYNLAFAGDKWDKDANTNALKAHTVYVEWAPREEINLLVGKDKLPYSRASLTSDSKLLVIDEPVSVEAAKKLFGANDPYYQPMLEAKGRLMDGVLGYYVAVADGWHSGETVQTGRTVYKSSPVFAGRVEISPPGLTEKKKSDAPLGRGKHLTLGLDGITQSAIEYTQNYFKENRSLYGFDLSGHYNGFSALFEHNRWKVKSTDPVVSSMQPNAWYAQVGYFIAGPNIEPVFRYEAYNQNSTMPSMRETDSTYGVNWYLKGHTLKLCANFVHTKYGGNATGKLANDDTKDVVQVQAQLYF